MKAQEVKPNEVDVLTLEVMCNRGEVKGLIYSAMNDAHRRGPAALISWFNHYATWNGYFAGCMTRLAADISEAKKTFVDPRSPWLNDRSNIVASYIFDTVRDEFDDSGTHHRDTHRTLAQAMICGMMRYDRQVSNEKGQEPVDPAVALAAKPVIHRMLGDLQSGFRAHNELGLFEAIGFHLASEFFGDIEYSTIDEWFTINEKPMQQYLKESHHYIDGSPHNCYAWINIHSGHGQAVEADHLKVAIEGANKALYFYSGTTAEAREAIYRGARKFVKHQQDFFKTVNYTGLEAMFGKEVLKLISAPVEVVGERQEYLETQRSTVSTVFETIKRGLFGRKGLKLDK